MKLSIVIPVYNEINTIREILRRVKEVNLDKEIIVVDDCSTDGTREVLQGISDHSIKIIFHEKNKGKGAALRTGFSQVTGEIIIVQDADLEYSPKDYPKLIEPIKNEKADVVYGSRFLGERRVFMFSHYLGNKLLTFITNLLYNTNLTDMETGYKAFKAEVLSNFDLKSNSFGFEPEFTAYMFKMKFRVYEVPISYDGRGYDEGKKITWKDGLIALYWLIRGKFINYKVNYETLLNLSGVKKYNTYIFNYIKPYIGDRVFEIGAGIGNFTRFLLGKKLVIASDIDDNNLKVLKNRIFENESVRILKFDITNFNFSEIKGFNINTIISLNVLEHIRDDYLALKNIYDFLPANGRLILLVPAINKLYGTLDKNLGHYGRYNREQLKEKLKNVGFEIEKISYLNLLGALGWWINSRLLKRKIITKSQLNLINFLTPLLNLEKRFNLPFGLSLLAICTKKFDI